MTISRKLTSLAAVVLLAGLSLSACGDKDSDGDSAAPKTDTKVSSKPVAEDDATLTKANFAQVLTASQAKAKSAHMTMSLGMAGQQIKAEGDVAVGSTPADSALAMTMDMGSMSFDMRLVDSVLYMDMGQVTGNKFVKIDLKDDSNPFAKQYGEIMDQVDPAKQIDQLKDAVKSIDKKGEPTTIDGVKAQPYVVTVDTTKLAALDSLPESAKSQMPDTIVYTMFIGPDNLPRRMITNVAGVETTIDYSKWGEPVDIKAPSADKISDKDLSQMGMPTPAA